MLVLIRTKTVLFPGKSVVRAIDLQTEATLEQHTDDLWEVETHCKVAGELAAQRLGDRMLSHGHIEDNTHRGAGLVFAFTDTPKEF